MIISNMGKIIDQSPYKRSYIEEHMGVSRNTVSNWCTGKTNPTAPQLFKLAYLLNKKVDDFYTYEEEGKEDI